MKWLKVLLAVGVIVGILGCGGGGGAGGAKPPTDKAPPPAEKPKTSTTEKGIRPD
jgi:hypothetical protein